MRCVGGIRCAGYRVEGIIAFPNEKRFAPKMWKWYRDNVHLPQALPEDFFYTYGKDEAR